MKPRSYLTHIFFWLILLVVSQSYAAASGSLLANNTERLLAKRVTYSKAIWCGNDEVVFDAGESGSFLLKLKNGARRKISNSGYIGVTSCAPNGTWLITVDTRTNQYDKNPDGHDEYAYTIKYFSRINLADGKSKSFALAQGGGEWSFDGTKILFFGKKPQLSIKQSHPIWELYWSHGWPSGTGGVVAWMPDSERLLLGHRGQFYVQRGQEITPLEMPSAKTGGTFPSITNIKVDAQQNIYVSTTDTKSLAAMYQLFKCTTDFIHINCNKIVGVSAGVIAFDVSRDGRKLVYVDEDRSHLYLVDTANMQSRLIANRVVGYPSISPDGRNVVFYRSEEGILEGFADSSAYILPLK